MAAAELAGIADILPPAAPAIGVGDDYWWLLALLPLLWWLWRHWQRSGRWHWLLWRLRRQLMAQRIDGRHAANLLWWAFRRQHPAKPVPSLKSAFDQARFAASPPEPSQLLRLLEQVRDVG